MTSALLFALAMTAAFVVAAGVTLLVASLWKAADDGSVPAGAALTLLLVFGLSFVVGLLGAP